MGSFSNTLLIRKPKWKMCTRITIFLICQKIKQNVNLILIIYIYVATLIQRQRNVSRLKISADMSSKMSKVILFSTQLINNFTAQQRKIVKSTRKIVIVLAEQRVLNRNCIEFWYALLLCVAGHRTVRFGFMERADWKDHIASPNRTKTQCFLCKVYLNWLGPPNQRFACCYQFFSVSNHWNIWCSLCFRNSIASTLCHAVFSTDIAFLLCR